jgi:hypothetical protein
MATIYKHGGEVGRIEKLTFCMLFCEDGKVLQNRGSGWKLWRKLKSGIDVRECFDNYRAEYSAWLLARPAFDHWRGLVHGFSLRKRALVVEAVRLLPADPDGLWSELEGMGCPVSPGEAAALLSAYSAAAAEQKRVAP